jgi:hypothetical protein
MRPIFDQVANLVSWLHGYLLLCPEMESIGHIQSGRIFDSTGGHRGQFGDGYFWTLGGEAVAFVEGASNGPALPAISLVASSPLDNQEELPALPALPEFPFSRLNIWSGIDWTDFMGFRNERR